MNYGMYVASSGVLTGKYNEGMPTEATRLSNPGLDWLARHTGKPVLGVCRGVQLINTAHGGTLHQHLPSVSATWQHEQRDLRGLPSHEVQLEPGDAQCVPGIE